VQLTSSPRRALGIFAVSALGVSTAVIGIGGVAQAATSPVLLTSSTTLTIPDGVCTVEWALNGAAGAESTTQAGGAGSHIVLHMSVTPGERLTADASTFAGGAGGAAAGNGGSGVGLLVDGALQVVAAGGGGAGNDSDGGDAGSAGASNGANTVTGGQPGTDSAGGAGGSAGGATGATDGLPGVDHLGGAGGSTGAGGGGGGYFGGGGGASAGVNGTGGGGGSNLIPDSSDAEVTPATGAASVTYTFQNCTADQVPAAPTDLSAQAADGQLTIDFTPNWDSAASPDTWQYRIGTGNWTDFTPTYTDSDAEELVVKGLTNGTKYTVDVRGVSGDHIPGLAGSVTGTPFAPIGAPTHVAYTVSGSVVTITWDAPATAGTFPLAGYQAGLGYSWGQSGGLAFMCETDVAVHVCKAPAPPGPSYSFAVNAVDAQGNAGDASQMITIGKTSAPASVPHADAALTVPGGGPGSSATGEVVKGQQVKLHGTGYQPNSLVSVIIYSTPQVLTAVQTDASGAFDVTVTVPAGLASGNHTLVAAGVDRSGQTRYMNLPITVTAGTAELAYTGASVIGPGIAGLLALVVGSGLLIVSRRRRSA